VLGVLRLGVDSIAKPLISWSGSENEEQKKKRKKD
jgi:hypothetical protein